MFGNTEINGAPSMPRFSYPAAGSGLPAKPFLALETIALDVLGAPAADGENLGTIRALHMIGLPDVDILTHFAGLERLLESPSTSTHC
jgi:hypothetical protein